MNGTPSAAATLRLAKAINVTVTGDTLAVDLEDGRTISVPIAWYPRLANGTPQERANFRLSGAGHGIHWPDLDEDIGIEGLLFGKKSTESPSSFERWLEARKQTPGGTGEDPIGPIEYRESWTQRSETHSDSSPKDSGHSGVARPWR